MSKYYDKKEEIRSQAIEWQQNMCYYNYSYSELAEFYSYFYKMGKRYGLLKEFKENAIC